MSAPRAPSGTATIVTAARTPQGSHMIRIRATRDPDGRWGDLSLVGLPADEHHTTRDRIRAAILNSGLTWPGTPMTLEVLGSPVPERDTGMDLACALALLTATGHLPTGYLNQVGCLGELGLDGTLRPIRDLEQRVAALTGAGVTRLIIPAGRATPAPCSSQPVIWAATSLGEIVDRLRGAPAGCEPRLDAVADPGLRRIAEIAAAGGHHILLAGCPAPVASLISLVLAGFLPDLDPPVAAEVGDLHWQAGRPRGLRLSARPPWIESASPLGPGTLGQPGPVSLAHHGVLCHPDTTTLDGIAIRVLLGALDTRRVIVREGSCLVTWPARTQLVLAHPDQDPPARIRPVADRIDIHTTLVATPGVSADPTRLSSTAIPDRILHARMTSGERWSATRPTVNAEVEAAVLQRTLHLLPEAYLRRRAATARVSTQGWVRVVRLAWTIADLAGHTHPDRADVDEAIACHTGGVTLP